MTKEHRRLCMDVCLKRGLNNCNTDHSMVRTKLVIGKSMRSFRRASGRAGVKRWNVAQSFRVTVKMTEEQKQLKWNFWRVWKRGWRRLWIRSTVYKVSGMFWVQWMLRRSAEKECLGYIWRTATGLVPCEREVDIVMEENQGLHLVTHVVIVWLSS